jgi:hypothetical protein
MHSRCVEINPGVQLCPMDTASGRWILLAKSADGFDFSMEVSEGLVDVVLRSRRFPGLAVDQVVNAVDFGLRVGDTIEFDLHLNSQIPYCVFVADLLTAKGGDIASRRFVKLAKMKGEAWLSAGGRGWQYSVVLPPSILEWLDYRRNSVIQPASAAEDGIEVYAGDATDLLFARSGGATIILSFDCMEVEVSNAKNS